MECAPVKRHFLGYFYASFLLSGMSLFLIYQRDMKTFKNPVLGGEIPAFTTVMVTGICMGIVLLGVRLLIGTGYQEEEIETNLLDYIENSYREPETTVRLSLWKMPEVLENGKKLCARLNRES